MQAKRIVKTISQSVWLVSTFIPILLSLNYPAFPFFSLIPYVELGLTASMWKMNKRQHQRHGEMLVDDICVMRIDFYFDEEAKRMRQERYFAAYTN